MKILATRRSRPSRATKQDFAQKKEPLLRPIDVRRQKALKAYWDQQKALGRDLNLARIGKRKGLPDGNMAHHCLNGRARLNVEWMLYFAHELGALPQVIWADDWPFPDMTAGNTPPDFNRLYRLWQSLELSAQAQILRILDEHAHP